VVSVAACAVVVSGAASSSVAKPVTRAGMGWGAGIEAALPPNAAPEDNGVSVSSISCPSDGNCSAVGSYKDNAGNTEGLLLTETAGSWEVGVEAVLPANANPTKPDAGLWSVSCASAGNCSAVGTYNDDMGTSSVLDNTEALLLTETAGRWSAGVEAALPADASPYRHVQWGSVSCSSAGNCTAAGEYDGVGGSFHGLLLTETDGSWAPAVEPVPPVPNASTWLQSVSCASAGNCTAVGGYYFVPSGGGALLMTETDGSWAPGVEADLPAGAATLTQSAELFSVSCASVGNCSAVGLYDIQEVVTGRDQEEERAKGVLLTETAGSWAQGVEAALPANADGPDALDYASLSQVSCASAGDCSAVGHYYDSSRVSHGLLLSEAAGSWAPGVEAVVPTATDQGSGLGSVSCTSAGNCSAVGYYSSGSSSGGLLVTETAGSWAPAVEPALPANASPNSRAGLNSVSCPSPGDCGAAGTYQDDSDGSYGSSGLLISGSPAKVTLDISKIGKGSGTVSSIPVGVVDCGSTCTASVDAGTTLRLTAKPLPGSRFGGWSGGSCSGVDLGECEVSTSISEQTVTAEFGVPPACVVPRLKGRTLRTARHLLGLRHCTLGKVKRAISRKVKKGHVISQRPRPGSRLKHGARVNFVVSKGKR
jgi:PASTA domain/Divergent InlB B-repeat domain